MERKDIIGLFFLLMSLLIVIDILILFPKIFLIFSENGEVFIFLLAFLVLMSLIVIAGYYASSRFIYLFWNSVFAAIIGASSFQVFIDSDALHIKIISILLIIYSLIVMFSMSQVAKHTK